MAHHQGRRRFPTKDTDSRRLNQLRPALDPQAPIAPKPVTYRRDGVCGIETI